MSIRKKILGGFIIIFSVGLIIGIIALIGTKNLTNLSHRQNEFQKHSSDIKNILNTHFIWRQDLTEAIVLGKDFTGSLDSENCALGKWINNPETENLSDPEILAILEKLKIPHAFIHQEAKDILNNQTIAENDEIIARFTATFLPKTEEVIKGLQEMENRYNALLQEKSEEIVNSGNSQSQGTLALLTASAIISILVAFSLTKSIMKPIEGITEAANSIIYDGNLEIELTHAVNDEIGKLTTSFQNLIRETRQQAAVMESLADGDLSVSIVSRSEKDIMNLALKKMINRLNDMISRIAQSTETVSEEAIKISENSHSLAQGATQQAAGVQELNGAISEVASKTKENAGKAEEAADMAKKIKENAEKGTLQMDKMTQAVKDINEASQSISNVIQTINDIAFQTNILALNAAVEAARAGVNGKGFAVVADEVRNLAAKSAVAAKDTGALIENAMEKAELGAKIAGETAVSLNEIVLGITQSTRIVEEIAKASEEQDSAITEINVGIEQVTEVIRMNTETAQSSAAAGEEMKSRFLELKDVVSRFNLSKK